MTSRRERSKRITPAALPTVPEIELKNVSDLDQTLKESIDYNLRIQKTRLEHHNNAYMMGKIVFIWLMCIIYVPLTVLAVKFCLLLVCAGEAEVLKEVAGFLNQKEFGIVLAVLCIIPIYLLYGLLKYNRIDSSQQADESDNIFPSVMSGP